MDFGNLKLEIYDLVGLIVPGIIAIGEGWVFCRGWAGATGSITQMGGAALTLMILLSFPLGNLIQELGDVAVKKLKGPRFFRQARDEFWASDEAVVVIGAIRKQSGQEVRTVDVAFDYCLSRCGPSVRMRDVFLATSDLCRSVLVLSVLAVGPVVRVVILDAAFSARSVGFGLFAIGVLAALAALSWRRMVRFRAMSDVIVFRVYLAGAEPH